MLYNPFIPRLPANLVIVDKRIDEESVKVLEKLELKVIKTIKCEEVDESLSFHPDIVIHPINHNTLMIAPNVFEYYEDKLYGRGINLIKGEVSLGMKYPKDISYNVGRLKGVAIHNFKYTDEKLKYYLKKENLEFVHVNQGYTKCSLSIVGEDSGITSDVPMYEKLTSIGFNILLVEPGHIVLEGQRYGFIGGTNGNISEDKLLFSGSFREHPNKDKILDFVYKNNKKIIYLSNKKIVDIGTIISLYSH